ncbi:N/A [soil metagenome]
MRHTLVARAPTRIDFGGGWTDVPPYPAREGGAVCNLAIARYATATVIAGATGPISDPSSDAEDNRLVRAALRRSPLSGVSAAVSNDFPVGAGLGGSSAAGVALAGALAELANAPLTRHALASLSRATEVEGLQVPGGYQDHFAAAFGGALFLQIGDDTVDVEEIALTSEALSALARRCVLVYTGESRVSGLTITSVRDGYLAGESRIVAALARMRSLASDMAAALRIGDIGTLGDLVGEHWVHQRSLHPGIPTERIDSIIAAAARAGARGAKALGASGGGCVVAIAEDGQEDELAQALALLGERITFAVDTTGFDVIATHAA